MILCNLPILDEKNVKDLQDLVKLIIWPETLMKFSCPLGAKVAKIWSTLK